MQMDDLFNTFPCLSGDAGSEIWTLPGKLESLVENLVAITPTALGELSTKLRANLAVNGSVLESPGMKRQLHLASTYLPPPQSQMPGRLLLPRVLAK